GSKSAQWDGPHPANFCPAFFEELVASIRRIVSEVKPQKTFYTLEPMPFMPPDTPESYLELLQAVDMKGFAVHADIVNILSSPRLFYDNAALTERFFRLLGPYYIASCHIKDLALGNGLTVHLSEVPMGQGGLDVAAYLRCVAALEERTTVVLEHQASAEAYRTGAEHLRAVAKANSIFMK
ncbi:MAG TPA: TIM barrel protein, partial [Clostridia bacterium]|nr:TIM barrel protein [Clostridia bacterium]